MFDNLGTHTRFCSESHVLEQVWLEFSWSDRAIMVGMQFNLRRVSGYKVLLLMAIATLASTVHASSSSSIVASLGERRMACWL